MKKLKSREAKHVIQELARALTYYTNEDWLNGEERKTKREYYDYEHK